MSKGGQKPEVRGQRNNASYCLAFLLTFILFFSISCSSNSTTGGADVQARLSNKELKYFTNGKKLYTQYCSNCHMDNGEGLGKLIPPLKDSDYLIANMSISAQMIVNGYESPIVVNGIEYNQPMPANKNLNPAEVIEILTYISNAWGNDYGSVDEPEIKSALSR